NSALKGSSSTHADPLQAGRRACQQVVNTKRRRQPRFRPSGRTSSSLPSETFDADRSRAELEGGCSSSIQFRRRRSRVRACSPAEGVRLMEFLSPAWFSALAAIVVIDLVLAGDNAIVIALACRNLPQRLRMRGIL